MTSCAGCSEREATLKCPTCVKLGVNPSEINYSYCSQACFKANWKSHKKIHKSFESAALASEQSAVRSKLGGDMTNSLSFSPKLASIKVTPNDPVENTDKNFPRNLHNASEIFLLTGNVLSARTLSSSTTEIIKLLENGPDGKSTMKLGRAVICWECGYAGIPKNADMCDKVAVDIKGVCWNCGRDGETNFLKIVGGEGGEGKEVEEVPWMEKNKDLEVEGESS
ncbi:hypothetical protein TrST_g3887 [Triparma strigata]|uniref:C6H2-type domain-containing protein n=1 Tax=Triparma strigata TaxID=1606541 RepID=A0A9W7BQH7_9STRA|nr:hypothetical protein TrST_g3887 [Triparma strigata]